MKNHESTPSYSAKQYAMHRELAQRADKQTAEASSIVSKVRAKLAKKAVEGHIAELKKEFKSGSERATELESYAYNALDQEVGERFTSLFSQLTEKEPVSIDNDVSVLEYPGSGRERRMFGLMITQTDTTEYPVTHSNNGVSIQAKNIKAYDGDEYSMVKDNESLITSEDIIIVEDGNTIYRIFATKIGENTYRKVEIAKKDSRKEESSSSLLKINELLKRLVVPVDQSN